MKFNPIKETIDGKKAHDMIWSTEVIDTALKGLERGKKLISNPFYENNTKLLKGDLVYERTKSEIEEWIKCRDNIIYFANNYCKLMTPTGIRKVEMRDYQEAYLKHLEKNRLSIFLSCRQSGKTTTSAIFLLHYILFNIDKNSLVLGNKRKTAVEILDKVKKIFLELPYFLKPGVYKWNEGQIALDNGCMCMAEATTINSGISFTFHCVLADEFAHIHPNILDKFYNNLFPTITAGKARFIISSTQNGYNLFYKLWCGSIEGENEYAHFKVDWWQVPEWNPETQRFEPRDEAWHQLQIANYGGEENFNKQFGTGFDISSNSLISSKKLKECNEKAIEFASRTISGISSEVSKYFYWSPEYDPQNLSKDFIVVTVDISEGLNQDYTIFSFNKILIGQRGDPSTTLIGYFRCNDKDVKWCANALGVFCNTMFSSPDKYLVSIEYNLYGELFVEYLKQFIDTIPAIMQNFNEEAIVKYWNENRSKYSLGIRVSRTNKIDMCKKFKNDFELNKIQALDTRFLYELENFSEKGNGTYSAVFGHDDLVMSEIQLEAVMTTLQWKNLIEDIQQNTMYIPKKYTPNEVLTSMDDIYKAMEAAAGNTLAPVDFNPFAQYQNINSIELYNREQNLYDTGEENNSNLRRLK